MPFRFVRENDCIEKAKNGDFSKLCDIFDDLVRNNFTTGDEFESNEIEIEKDRNLSRLKELLDCENIRNNYIAPRIKAIADFGLGLCIHSDNLEIFKLYMSYDIFNFNDVADKLYYAQHSTIYLAHKITDYLCHDIRVYNKLRDVIIHNDEKFYGYPFHPTVCLERLKKFFSPSPLKECAMSAARTLLANGLDENSIADRILPQAFPLLTKFETNKAVNVSLGFRNSAERLLPHHLP